MEQELRERTASVDLHHVGFAVASIAAVGEAFARCLGVRWDGTIIHDPLQQARVAFLQCGSSRGPSLELIEPSGDESPLHRFLTKGGGLHHVCYEVDSVRAQLEQSRAAGCLIVKPPLPAVAFAGRHVAWVYTCQKLLVEYLER
jgi:methylmalonyl-CoA/ethylmalonyl-CoA epimerase